MLLMHGFSFLLQAEAAVLRALQWNTEKMKHSQIRNDSANKHGVCLL